MASETRLGSESGARRGKQAEVCVPNQGIERLRERRECKKYRGVNVQDGKLPRLQTEDGEEGETDDKEGEGGQVEAAEQQETVPATYYRPGSARFLA